MRAELPAVPATRSEAVTSRAEDVLVGGVNSPVRTWGAVGDRPLIVECATGAILVDADGRELIDLIGAWGPAIVGHAHPAVVDAVRRAAARGLGFGATAEGEVALAERIRAALPGIDLVRFVNSGTEATMSAVRLARAATRRSLIVKFLGGYHGHADGLLVAAGSGAATHGVPDSDGVPESSAALTLPAPYNDAGAVDRLMARHAGDVAAVIVEPVAGNMGLVRPEAGFLERLRRSCDEHGAILIFDEVMTGFRTAWGGAQRLFGVRPDLTCLGKVIGGGLPVGAYAGSRELMERVSPSGPVYQAGTFSGNPVVMAAGLATLELCGAAGFYERLHAASARLADGLRRRAADAGVPVHTDAIGGMVGLAFTDRPVRDHAGAHAGDHERSARFCRAMRGRGVALPPSSYETLFVSAAHDDPVIDRVLDAAEESFREVAT